MLYTYDSMTGGAKRIDWDLTDNDLTKDEEQALETLIRRFLSRRPFANDIEDIDFSLSINVTGKWHDEYPNYEGVGEEYDLSELEADEKKRLLNSQTAQGRFDSATSNCPRNERGFTDKWLKTMKAT